jgi:hypothetical protein
MSAAGKANIKSLQSLSKGAICADILGGLFRPLERALMSLLDKIPLLDDSALKNLLDNARRLESSGSVKQKADALELLPALEAAVAARKAVKLEAAAEKRSANKKPAAPRTPRAAKAKGSTVAA